MSLLDRYVRRNFLEPFLMCFGGAVAIWFLIDVSDNFRDLLEAHATFGQILGYYVVQVPKVMMTALPVSLVVVLLLSGGRRSWIKPNQGESR